MSQIIGHLRVVGRGGLDVFVFDDALVRAWCGMGSALQTAADNAVSSGGAAAAAGLLGNRLGTSAADALASRMTGERLRMLSLTPEQIAQENNGKNRLIPSSDVQSAVLAGKRFQRGQRSLTLELPGETVKWSWSGDGARRPLNDDGTAVAVLRAALGDRLTVDLRGR